MPQLGSFARPDGYIEFYNRGWYEYTGSTPEAMQGWGWRSVHDPTLLRSIEARWRHSIDTGTAFELAFPLRRHDGVFRWFLTRVNPQRDDDGRIVRWVGINTDVDDQRQSEQQLALVLEGEQRARRRGDDLATENARLYEEAREQMEAHVQLNRALREAFDRASLEAAERARAEDEIVRQREELAAMWTQAPIPICVLAGEALVFELANPAYVKVVGGRAVVGKPLLEALPETRGQGFDDLLRGVMHTGEAVVQNETLVKLERDGVLQDTYFPFIYSRSAIEPASSTGCSRSCMTSPSRSSRASGSSRSPRSSRARRSDSRPSWGSFARSAKARSAGGRGWRRPTRAEGLTGPSEDRERIHR